MATPVVERRGSHNPPGCADATSPEKSTTAVFRTLRSSARAVDRWSLRISPRGLDFPFGNISAAAPVRSARRSGDAGDDAYVGSRADLLARRLVRIIVAVQTRELRLGNSPAAILAHVALVVVAKAGVSRVLHLRPPVWPVDDTILHRPDDICGVGVDELDFGRMNMMGSDRSPHR